MELHKIESKRPSLDGSVCSVARNTRSQTSLRLAEGNLPTLSRESVASRSNANGAAPPNALPPLSREQKVKGYIQFITLCWTLFLAGWNDGTVGPLIPRIREVYHLGFALVSLVFVFACLGFVVGAFSNMFLNDRYGFGKTIVFGAVFQVVAYAIQAAAPPYPAFILGFTINGIGLAIQDAQANGFVAAQKRNAETKMGILHAAYGLGAFASPLAATQFAQLPRWSFHFLVSLGIAVSNLILLIAIFKFRLQDDCLLEAGEVIPERPSEPEGSSFKRVMSTKAVHLLAIFILIYVGVEVTIGGWIVTFIIEERGGGPSSGYISSGFFGGLTAGRVVLLWVNKKIGERRVIFLYSIASIALELTIWLVPSLIGNAVAVSIVGVLLGPMYPIAMNQASRILPRRILTSSIGWIAGFGQAGSALIPFITGAIASKHGIISLQPLLVSMMAFMMILWIFVPRQARRTD